VPAEHLILWLAWARYGLLGLTLESSEAAQAEHQLAPWGPWLESAASLCSGRQIMRVTVTPTATQALREVSTQHGLSHEWNVTFQIDGEEGIHTAISFPVPATSPPEAISRALRKLERFLAAANQAAQNYQV
jgi:hypothetical protein